MTIQEKFMESFASRAEDDNYTKWEWASSAVFDLATYDSGLDEKFVRKILEVCKVILNDETYEYIDCDETNYINYILVCQLLYHKNWINWGTSIRGAWFESDICSELIINDEYWTTNYDGSYHVDLSVKFSKENLQELINFIESD